MHIRDEFCAFNRIYKLNGALNINGLQVKDYRKYVAKAFSDFIREKHQDKFDIVTPIPNTGKLYTPLIAEELKLPEVSLVEKVRKEKTLALGNSRRKKYYDTQLLVHEENIDKYRDARILFIDEALISGITLNAISNLCSKFGIKHFTFGLMSPPIYLTCPFSHINSKERMFYIDKLLAYGLICTTERAKDKISCDNIVFTPYSSFKDAVGGSNVCSLCFFDESNES